MDRKYCADCGQPNLDTESHCWACGSARFAPPGTKPVGDRTIAFGYSAGDQTVAWDGAPPRRPAWVMPSAIAGLAVVACLGGYLLGKATWGRPAPAAEGARVTSVTLPALPRSAPPSPTQVAEEPALVTVRTQPGAPPSALPVAPTAQPRTPTAPDAPTTTEPPAPVVYPGGNRPPAPGAMAMEPRPMEPTAPPPTPAGPRIRVNLPPPSPPVTSVRSGGSTRAAAPTEESPLPSASREQSVVALRNDSSESVEVTLDGNGSRTAHIPPGSTVPIRLEPGTYQIKAASGSATSASSSLSLKRSRTYSMLVNRQRENGKEYLVLIEPLEPSFDE